MDQVGIYSLGKITNKYLIFEILSFACFDNLAPYALLHLLTRRMRALSIHLFNNQHSPSYLNLNTQSIPIFPSYDPYTVFFQNVDMPSLSQVLDILLSRQSSIYRAYKDILEITSWQSNDPNLILKINSLTQTEIRFSTDIMGVRGDMEGLGKIAKVDQIQIFKSDDNVQGRYVNLKQIVKCRKMVLEWVYIGDIEYILKHLCQPT